MKKTSAKHQSKHAAIGRWWARSGVEVTPKGIIRMALGGYSTPGSEEATDKVVAALLKHMADHGLDMVVVKGTSEGQSIRFFGKNV